MKESVPYEDAVDLLDADHKAVKKLFIDYDAMCQDGAPAQAKSTLALQICQALALHAQIEEEIFYPAVRGAIGDDTLMDEAAAEHAEAKQLIARIQPLAAAAKDHDALVKQLAKLIDQHVSEEREQLFLQARNAPLDLRGLAVPLYRRKKELTAKPPAPVKEAA